MFHLASLHGPRQAKRCLWTCRFSSTCACAKYHSGLCSLFNNYVSGQLRPWSDCANAQADLGLCWLHVTGNTFSLGGSPYHPSEMIIIFITTNYLSSGVPNLYTFLMQMTDKNAKYWRLCSPTKIIIFTINVKKIAFENKEHTTDQKMGVLFLLRQ